MDQPTVSDTTLRLVSDLAPQVVMAPLPVRPLTLRLGFDMQFEFTAPTPLVLMLNVHPEVMHRLDSPERIDITSTAADGTITRPIVDSYLDTFGNRCARLLAPVGLLKVFHDVNYRDTYQHEPQPLPSARQHRADELPANVLPYLLGSRYCEVDRVGAVAWDLFGKLTDGGERAIAINRWVFENIKFGYKLTRPNKTALDTYVERNGVCRDMMHLAIAFCRAMNIPARYATGYLGDIDADPDPTPMDFSAFFEVYLEGKWWPMDARHGKPRIGRVLMGRGRDAADCALITSFGRHRLAKFTVVTDELTQTPGMTTVPTNFAMSA
jgi:transglutaminase-like putative cysteine protease